jgi:hypothetical protein
MPVPLLIELLQKAMIQMNGMNEWGKKSS